MVKFPVHLSVYVQKRGTQKGYIDLSKVKVVEKVLDGAFDKPSFQVSFVSCLGGGWVLHVSTVLAALGFSLFGTKCVDIESD